ncbi:MAG: hypothetical protein RI907_181 [Pseudomonadota bacterium]|jgi:hypothetical protein
MSRQIARSLPRPSALMALMAGAALVAALASPSAHALEVVGVKLDDGAKVAGQSLVLSGAGLRTKVIKLYVLGVYFNKKETSQAAVLGNSGAKRFQIVMLRDFSGDEFGVAFLAGINKNLDKDEKAKLFGPLAKLGEAFERIGGLKKGDVVVGDWVPGHGTTMTLNGKPVTEPFTDPLFYNAVLRIWYGDKPAEVSLKKSLLGEELNY